MRIWRNANVRIVLVALVLSAGCGDDAPESATSPTTTVAAKAANESRPAAAVTPAANVAVATPSNAVPSPAAKNGAIPFNLFAPPKIEVPVIKQSDTRKENEEVRLIGFVDVDNLKALLAFDGQIRPMEVGDTHNDVEIVAIEPPRVTLQRGRQRWITALFEQPLVNTNQAGPSGASSQGPQVTIGSTDEGGRRGNQPVGINSWFPNEMNNIFGQPADRTGRQVPIPMLPGLPGPDDNSGAPLPGLPPLPTLPTP